MNRSARIEGKEYRLRAWEMGSDKATAAEMHFLWNSFVECARTRPQGYCVVENNNSRLEIQPREITYTGNSAYDSRPRQKLLLQRLGGSDINLMAGEIE